MKNRLAKALRAWRGKSRQEREILSDTLGAYTGVPEDPDDPPEQDADDL